MDNKPTSIRSSLPTATNSTVNYHEVFSELVPVLTQCFGVILLGYIAGLLKIFSEPQAKGLNLYVTRFALPIVFFRAMVTINFSGVCWSFVMAISISKLIGFIMAITFTYLISRRFHLGIAAIVAMFVSQTNDVALAYPILYALFPDLASYIYLFAPIQLIVLNPFAYFLLELERVRLTNSELKPLIHSEDSDIDRRQLIDGKSSNSVPSCGRCQQLTQVMFNVLKNPLIFMTLIGIIFNLILKHHLPVYINGLLSVIADSFSATALFSLGYSMVGKMSTITQREVYILTTILLTKLLIVPFITRELVVQMMPIALANETLRYSTFGFLYGTTPTAPPVFLFAAEYQVIPVAIGVGLVLGTFLCAPIMFIFARIITLYNAEPSDYAGILGTTVEDISWISIVCCIWTLGVLCVSRKAIRVPNRFTLCHLICVLFTCTGLLLGRFVNYYYYGIEESVNGGKLSQPIRWLNYLHFAIFFFGSTGTRCWTTLIALVLVMERARSLCFVLRYQLHIYLTGFLTPAVVTGLLLLTSFGHMVKDIDPIFQCGTNQLIISILVLIVNASGTLACLISFIRIDVPVQDCYEIKASPDVAEGICRSQLCRNFNDFDKNDTNQTQQSQQTSPSNSIITDSYRITRNSDDSELLSCRNPQIPQSCDSAKFCNQCDKKQRKECAKILARYCETHQPSMISSTSATHPITQQISLGLELDNVHAQGNNKPPHHKHVIFLILILVTMFLGICLCTWRLVHDAPTGVYIVLEFLDGSFNFGQGVVLFVLFGLDADLFIAPIKRFHFTSKQFNGSFNEALHQTTVDKSKIDKIVNQFVKFHLKSCSTNIGTEKTINSIHYEQIFYQYTLEQWLIAAGITDSNEETLCYIECLELGNIITCINPMTNESFMHKDTMTAISNTKRLLTFTAYAWGLHNISY
ncbi:unnamed protein product [Schistosoma intercalatum]|nr:unnamed protein product [Schistosoma intercalatum]CAH8604872.1 unnamed protein product [Schistosoma intercalatum]